MEGEHLGSTRWECWECCFNVICDDPPPLLEDLEGVPVSLRHSKTRHDSESLDKNIKLRKHENLQQTWHLAVPGFPEWRENQHPQAETH